MKLFVSCFILIIVINSVFGGWWSDLVSSVCRKCPSPQTVSNFDLNKYAGKWYEIYKAGDVIFEHFLKCVTAEYTVNTDGSINVAHGAFNEITKKATRMNATAFVTEPNSGKLKISYKLLNGAIKTSGNYWVIETDYIKYALVYSCDISLCFFKNEATWVLSRGKTLDTDITKFVSTLQAFSPISKSLKQTTQDCMN